MNYEMLFSVSFHHEYYRTKKYKGFSVEYDRNTNRLLKSFNMIVRESDAGFMMLFPDENDGSLLRSLKDKLVFTFFMGLRDKTFMNYSEVHSTVRNNGYWFSNLKRHQADPSLIHEGRYVGEDDRIRFISGFSDINMTDSESVEVEDMFGNTIFTGSPEELGMADLWESPGYLKITTGRKRQKYYCKHGNNNEIAGVIDIVLDPGSQTLNFDAVKGSDFKIAIETRSVTLKYNLINRDKYQYSDFKIYAGKERLASTAGKQVETINGEMAYSIETITPVRLQERYDHGLELEMIRENGERNTKRRINLPAPEINKVKVAGSEDKYQAYSEMYIYF